MIRSVWTIEPSAFRTASGFRSTYVHLSPMKQGASAPGSAQFTPSRLIFPMQHPDGPPSRNLQPGPPHEPHEDEQHATPLELLLPSMPSIPLLHVSSKPGRGGGNRHERWKYVHYATEMKRVQDHDIGEEKPDRMKVVESSNVHGKNRRLPTCCLR